MTPCPSCSEYRHGQWVQLIRPMLWHGKHALRFTLDPCGNYCPVFGAGPGWIEEMAGPVPISQHEALMPARRRTPDCCHTILARWWRRRAGRFNVSQWDADKLRKWREIE